MAGLFRHRPAELDEWGPIMDTDQSTAETRLRTVEALHADLRVRCAELEAALVTARAERDSAVRGTAAAVRDLVARVAAVEAVCHQAETDDAFNFTTGAVRAAIRGEHGRGE